jgi:diguanylate cyclase (GGDEF)-like protein
MKLDPSSLWLFGFLVSIAAVAFVVYAVDSRRSRRRLNEKVAELLEVKRQLEEANAALAAANAALERLSAIDSLTGIANRRRLDEAVVEAMGRAAREGEPLAAAMIDIDYFKAYNDRYGHPAGDDCLRRVATTIQATLERPADLAARYGGEEFLLLLPNTDLGGAAFVAERARAAIEALAIPHSESRAAEVVTVSVGYASLRPERQSDSGTLVDAADRALYAAKERGRNRISD